MDNENARSSLELLYNISRDLANEIELRPLLKRVLTLSVHNVGAERGSIVVLNEQNKPIDAAIIYGDKIYSHTLQQLRETIEKGMAGWVVRHHKCVLVNDTRQDQRWVRRPDDEANRTGAKSALCVPLLAQKKLVGVLTVVHPTVGFFTVDHMNLLQSISDIAGIAIVNARLYDDSQRRTQVMAALIDNAVSLNSSLNLDEVLKRLVEQTTQALRVDLAALGFLDADGKEIEFKAAWGDGSQTILNTRLPAGRGIAGTAVSEGKALIGQFQTLKDIDQFPGYAVQSMAAAPIRADDKVIGVLVAINPKGNEFVSDSLTIMNAIGSVAGTAIRNAQNFSQVQASNQLYTELFEDYIDPIIITDMQGRIVEANRQACSVLQYTKEQITSLPIKTVHEVNVEILGESFNKLEPNGTLNYESLILTQTGREIPVQASVRRIHFSGVDSLQWLLRDISERIDLDSLRNDLIAMVYHDLRSPLANVTASLDILSSLTTTDRDDTTVSLLNIAMRSSDRIQRLLNSLLDVYRLEAGQTIVNRKEVDPVTLVNEVIDIIHPALETKNQTVTQNLSPDLPLIWVDIDMIRRVLVNLVENASKFSPMDAKIDIGADQVEGYTRFWVSDDGPGIPTEDQDKIFDKFSRLKTTGATKGMGLGLTFCRVAITGHGGKIWVESTPGKGSAFYFTLPNKGIAEQPA
jgi:two-component system, NtrC family, sensor histidine kinase KinB